MDSQAHPLPHGLSWSSPLCSVRFPRGIPFFDPAGMLVDFDRGAVQHQRCFVHQILLNQGCEDIFPYSSFCPGTEPAVHTLPWPEPLRQIPPWYSGVQPIQDCVEHFPVAFSRLASLQLFFRRKLILDPIPLFFRLFHVLYSIILSLYTQYLSFKTDSRLSLLKPNAATRGWLTVFLSDSIAQGGEGQPVAHLIVALARDSPRWLPRVPTKLYCNRR